MGETPMLLPEEVVEERSLEHLDLQVCTPSGLKKVTHACRTIPLSLWRVTTDSRTLLCAAKHLIAVPRAHRSGWEFFQAQSLEKGMLVMTESGVEIVREVVDTGAKASMYDLRVEGPEHVYYTNGFLSHNSTGIAAAVIYRLTCMDSISQIYIAPMQEHVKTFRERLREMENASIFPPSYYLAKGKRNNLNGKEGLHGGSWKCMHILNDPTKVRGSTIDHADLDECISRLALINCQGYTQPASTLSAGQEVLAFRRDGSVTTDKVLRIVPKGLRHTWNLVTVAGDELTLTGNARIFTEKGWCYLGELLLSETPIPCKRARAARDVGCCRYHGIRNNAGRREYELANCVSTLPSSSWTCPGRVLPSEGGAIGGLYSDARPRGSQLGLWRHNRKIRNIELRSLREVPGPVLRARGFRQVEKIRVPSLGGSLDMGGGGLVDPGRRVQASGRHEHFNALVLEGGMRSPGAVADRSWRGGQVPPDAQKEHREFLLDHHDRRRCSCRIGGENSTVHAPFPALQNRRGGEEGAAEARMPLLRVGVLRSQPHAAASLLQKEEVSQEEESRDQHRQPHQDRRERRGLREDEVSRAQSPADSGSDCDRKQAGELSLPRTLAHGAWLQGENAAAEKSSQGQENPGASGRGVSKKGRKEEGIDAGPRLLRELAHEAPCLHGEEARESFFIDYVEIKSITYAGEQEVMDIETEKHHTFFAGGIAVHNCQDLDAGHFEEIEQIMKASHRPSIVFSGTSKEMNTLLETKYQEGSRGVWMIPTHVKNKWINLNNPKDIEKIIKPQGMTCPWTGRPLNPMMGEFVHENPELERLGKPSFHLPQMIVPEYASDEKWLEIYTAFKKYPWAKFLKEIMGIPTEAGLSEISINDLKALCIDTTFAKIQHEIMTGKRVYRYITSGCDWGGSDHDASKKIKVSYTVHVMLGMRPDGRFDLIHAKRYEPQSYYDIAGDIMRNHVRLRGFAMGADHGGGDLYNALMRDAGSIPSGRFFQYSYGAPKRFLQRIKDTQQGLYMFSLHRSDSLSAVIGDIKKQRFVCPRWDESSTFLMDCLNMFRTMTEAASTGRTLFRYLRDPAKADDFFHALNYATITMKVLIGESSIPNAQVIAEMQLLMQQGGSGLSSILMPGAGDGYSSHSIY